MSNELNQDLSMSDEDFLNMMPPTFEPPAEGLDNSGDDDDDTTQEDDTTSLQEETQEEEELEEADESDDSTEDDLSSEESDEDDEDADEDNTEVEGDEVDYEALHNQLLQPFKANGSEMSVNSVEEAQKLMQMGANYSKKMAALKPNLKLMKMLENNELLDESKLSLLIDVASGNPEAISQLVRDNEIDPLTINTSEENKYTPKNHTVGDHQVELDEVISRIQDTASFSDTMEVVSSKWDESSKRDIASNPNQLEVINAHVSNGTYAKVQAEVDRIKVFGGLQGVSDFDAYKQVGEQLFKAGKITIDGTPKPTENIVVPTKPKAKKSDNLRKDKRKAASPVKNSGKSKEKKFDFNPLAMTDEEFENFKF
jgi:hypothetical protein